jgi:hypothetical protein
MSKIPKSGTIEESIWGQKIIAQGTFTASHFAIGNPSLRQT